MIVGTSTAAVIVTYNRADKLSKVIDGVLQQDKRLDAVFVIDNNSTDDTAAVVASKKSNIIHHLELPENIGGAGGFFEGIKAAYGDGYDFLWIMDDDCYPEPNALSELVGGLQTFEDSHARQPSFACSAVHWTNGDICEMNIPVPVWDWQRFYSNKTPNFLVGSCSFVSVLIPRWAIARHGLPIKEYFIWYDDAEYTQRLAGTYPGIYCPNSKVVHDIPENKGVNFSLVNEENVWKFLYGARNQSSYRWETQGIYGTLSFFRFVHTQMREGQVATRLRLKVFGAVIKGVFFHPQRVGV